MQKVNKKESDVDISCEVHLFEHADKIYKPGDRIHGIVKYTLKKETIFHKIGVALRGFGELHVTWTEGTGKDENRKYYKNKQNYIDIDYVNIDSLVKDNNVEGPTPAGVHEIPFSFVFPENIPPTFEYDNYIDGYKTRCKIFYYIRIKFERPGFSKYNKKFRTDLNVGNVAKPTMVMTPIVYGIQKKPFQPFRSKEKVVSIKSTIENSVTTPEGHIKVKFEINNGTKLDIKELRIKLTERIAFTRSGDPYILIEYKTCVDNIVNTKVIKQGDTEVFEVMMMIPQGLMTLQNSNQVSINYFIEIVAGLSFPHRDAVLKMPIEIVYNHGNDLEAPPPEYEHREPPPSYNEVMAEYNKVDLQNV